MIDWKSLAIYFINAIFVYLCVKKALKYDKKQYSYKLFLVLAVLIPSILGGLRYGIGTDYFGRYLPDFKIIQANILADTKVEYGFEFISRVVVFFHLDFQFMLFVVQLLTNGFILAGLLKYKDKINPAFAMFVYMLLYYQTSYNTVRQCLSMAIIFYSLSYILEKKLIRYVLMCLLASSIHNTAIIFLPIYFLFNLSTSEMSKILKYIIYIFVVYVILNFESVFNFIGSIFGNQFSLGYYLRYIEALEGNEENSVSFYFLFKWMLYVLPGLVAYFSKKHNEQKEKNEYNFFLLYTIIGFFVSIEAYLTNSMALNRLAYYFDLGLIYLIPRNCQLSKKYISISNKKIKFISIFYIVVLMTIWVYEFFIKGYSQTVPYEWIFR